MVGAFEVEPQPILEITSAVPSLQIPLPAPSPHVLSIAV